LPAAAKTAPRTSAKAESAHALAVPFIADDYETALKLAREKNVPIFVDAWATWCHTCRSMKAFVLSDPSLTPRSDQFVWLLYDVENPKNAALKDKFPTNALPTFYVVNPKDETIARRWVGGMTLAQVQGFLDDGRSAVAGGDNGNKLAEADKLYGEANYKAAGDAYLAAWPSIKTDDPQYTRVAEAMLYALSTTDRNSEVIALAEQAEPGLVNSTTGASLAVSALASAIALPAGRPEPRRPDREVRSKDARPTSPVPTSRSPTTTGAACTARCSTPATTRRTRPARSRPRRTGRRSSRAPRPARRRRTPVPSSTRTASMPTSSSGRPRRPCRCCSSRRRRCRTTTTRRRASRPRTWR
jgi:thioredoxin-like negative regulator of GroEL